MEDGVEGVRTGHVTDAFTDTCAHTYDAYLAKGVLVKPLRDECAGGSKGEVEAGWAHVTIEHGGGEVEKKDQMADDGPADGSCGN